MDEHELVARLRRAGCVFAEEEARALRDAADRGGDLETLCARREAGEFLERVVGSVELAGERLAVGPGTFVPRQRTRLLIEQTLAALERTRAADPARTPVLVEACCGAAPIAAIAARRLPGIEVHATDRSAAALADARRNLPTGAGIHRGDLLAGLPSSLVGRVDVLAAVPPYVPSAQIPLMSREAREHEDRGALDGGADGLAVVRALADSCGPWLRDPGGILLLEMHAAQADGALAHASACGLVGDVATGTDGRTGVLRLHRRRTERP
ncbi:SAM-dependent methyltransferase [Brachybacterium sp. DNPG3]